MTGTFTANTRVLLFECIDGEEIILIVLGYD